MTHYSPEFIAARRNDLLTMKQELITELDEISSWDEELGAYVAMQPDFGGASAEDSGDTGEDAEVFQERMSRVEDMNQTLSEINGALERIDQDTYGKCATGGEYMDEARLEAYPAAADCADHQA